MRAFRVLKLRLRSVFRRSDVEAEMQREIEMHLELLRREAAHEGQKPAAVERLARLRFGSGDAVVEACRDARRVTLVQDFFRDLRFSLRQLRRSPAFAVTAVLSLALGIGANAVVFGVFDSLLLKSLPIPDAGRVLFVNNGGSTSVSFPDYREVRDRNAVFTSLFAYRMAPMALEQGGSTDRVWGLEVTGNYWQTLEIQPAVGRFFTPEEDQHPNASPYAVLSYEYWRQHFGGDAGVVGRTVTINGSAYTVTGVAPAGFHGTEAFYWPELWVPMMMEPQIEGTSWLDNPNTFNAWMAGRLKPRITEAQAEANLATIAAQLARENKANEGIRFVLSAPGLAGNQLRGPVKAFGDGLLLLSGIVLLAACANLAALLSARALDRERDLALRVSLGAGRGRLIRQLLTEALTLATLGGAVGYLLAATVLRGLSHWRAPLDFPIQFDLSPNWAVFGFAFVATLATVLLFGAAPARQAWNANCSDSLKGATARPRWGGWSVRDLLLPAQLALCALLVSASLVAASGLARSLRAPLGFQPDGAAMAGYDFNLSGYPAAAAPAIQAQLLDRARQIPGVESVAFSNSMPLSIDQSSTTVYRDGTTDFRPRNGIRGITYYQISPGYLHTMETRLLTGRDFTERDDAKAPAVAIVNRRLAILLTGSADAVGKSFLRGATRSVEIVGVVEDGKYTTLTEAARPAVYWPMAQEYNSTRVLIARSAQPSEQVALELRDAIHDVDPHLAIYGVGGVRRMLGLVYLPMWAALITLGAFGFLALMLSFTGIYGLTAYAVSRRQREIGIRMALGAGYGQVLRFLFARIGMLVAGGTALGLAAGVGAAGVLASIVYDASPREPGLIAGAVVAIGLVGLAAGAGPARRALRTDPVQSLRQE